jgi:hypothetical protein
MLMEALFSRGGYPIHHRINGFNYVFRRNDDGDFVCPVLSGEHRQMMAKSGNFRVYQPKEKVPVLLDAQIIATRPMEPSEEVVFAPGQGEPAGSVEAQKPRKGGRRKKG